MPAEDINSSMDDLMTFDELHVTGAQDRNSANANQQLTIVRQPTNAALSSQKPHHEVSLLGSIEHTAHAEIVDHHSRRRSHGNLPQVSRSALGFPIFKKTLSRQWAEQRQREPGETHTGKVLKRVRAIFIVSHEFEIADGVVDAVQKELSDERKDIKFEVSNRGTLAGSRHILIDAPSVALALQSIELARDITDEATEGKSVKTTMIFVEPPSCPVELVDVQLRICQDLNQRRQARPEMLPCRAICFEQDKEGKQNSLFTQGFCHSLTLALKRVGGINTKFNLRIELGHFYLTSYPQQLKQRNSFAKFLDLMGHPRTAGVMITQTGDMNEALRVLAAIKRESSPFSPVTMEIFAAAEVRPTFVFEASSTQHRLRAALHPEGDAGVGGRQGSFRLSNIEAFSITEPVTGELDFATLSIDQEFDWRITTSHESPLQQPLAPDLEASLRSAQIYFSKGQGDKDEHYPRVQFSNTRKVCAYLGKVALKSTFYFKFADIYVIEFTICREWNSVLAMSDLTTMPRVTFGLTMQGENWGHTRALEVAKPGQGWGTELEYLLESETGQPSEATVSTGQARVQSLVRIIWALREAVSDCT